MPGKSSFVVVANRLPVRRVRKGWQSTWQMSPGGLVSALTPLLIEQKGTWVGWTGSTGQAPAPFHHEGIHNVPVALSRAEVEEYYEGFSNGTLWPLFHDAIRPPAFHREWWRRYVDVNDRFARATAEVARRGGTVWIQDYHLLLVPGMLRRRRPDLRIGFFLHIPLPPSELFGQLPWRDLLLEGLAGADLVGFQTEHDAQNFGLSMKRFVGARVKGGWVQVGDREVRFGCFPISIDFDKYDGMARSPETDERVARLRKRLGKERRIVLGVDRLDYTKGIDVRLKAFSELAQDGELNLDEVVMVQVATPSREAVLAYKRERERIEHQVGSINGQFSSIGRVAVQYLHKNLPFDELVALYRAACVMMVTPLKDGMNLVAKEFVACHPDEQGVLLLSEFAGAARELRHAIQVNPHDVAGVAESLKVALAMPPPEQKRRMRRLRKTVSEHTVFDWASSFMNVLEGA